LADAVVLKVTDAKVVTNAATGLLGGTAATKTDWTVGGTGLTGIAALDALTQDQSLALSGTVVLNAFGVVMATGTVAIEAKSVTVAGLGTSNLLLVGLEDAALFVGVGGTLSAADESVTDAAAGFYATGVTLDVAVLRVAPQAGVTDTRSWTAVAGTLTQAGLVGLGDGVTFTAKSFSFRANLAAGLLSGTPATRIGWSGLTGVAAL